MPDMWMDVDVALSEVPINKVALIDDTNFKSREESVTYDQAGLDLVWNFVTTAGAFTQTAVTPTDTGGDYDFVNQGNAMYTIEVPDSGGGSINNDTEGFGWFTGFATGILPWTGPVIGFRAEALNNALIDGGDNLDVSLTHVMGTILTETAGGRLAAALIKLLDVATPVLTGESVNQSANNNTILAHADYGNAKLVRSTTPANALDVNVTGEAGLDLDNTSGTIDAAQIGADAITNAKIANDAIAVENIKDAAITAAKLAGDCITNAKIANDALAVEQFADGFLTVDKIAANAITAAKIAGDAITNAKIANDALDSEQFADAFLTAAKIDSNAITAAKIASDAITDSKMAPGCIAKGDQLTGLNDLSAAQVNAEVDTGLSDYAPNTVVPDAAGVLPTAEEVVDEWESQSQADPTGFHVNVLEINSSVTAAPKLAASADTSILGTVGATDLTTTTCSTDLSLTDADQLKGKIIVFRHNTTTAGLRYQATDITAFTVANGVLTFTAITTAPSAGDTLLIV